jgi:hypothetical protein
VNHDCLNEIFVLREHLSLTVARLASEDRNRNGEVALRKKSEVKSRLGNQFVVLYTNALEMKIIKLVRL